MGTVVIEINESGALKVTERYSLRPLLRALRPEDVQRHRVFKYVNCSSVTSCVRTVRPRSWALLECDTSQGNTPLYLLFAYLFLILTVMSFIIAPPSYGSSLQDPEVWNSLYRMCLIGRFLLERFGVIPCLIVVAVVVAALVCLFPVPPIRRRRREVQTISALVQQV